MATVQLIDVASGEATVQRDQDAPVRMTWGLLHEAQQQDGAAGYVYRWLMAEYCRCEFEARQGRPWQSPRRTVEEIVADLQARDAREAAERGAARRAKQKADDEAARQLAIRQERERVEAERTRTAAADPWWPIPSREVPQGVRFDTPRRNQGQIVEVSYGTFGAAEADSCDPYMGVIDHSDGSWSVYRRHDVS